MTLPPRLKWKLNRYQRLTLEKLETARNLMLSVWNRQRMCPACRALVDRRDSVCPLCGERMRAVSSGVLGRSLDLVLPEQGRVTFILLSANLLLFLLTMIASMERSGSGFQGSSIMGSIDVLTLVRFGAKYGPLIQAGEWWRFVTPIFLHGGLLHLGFNSWVLYDLGPAVEGLYGRQKFVVLYVLSGIMGVLASFLWNPRAVSIGASGAVFGLIGAMITYGYRNRRSASDPVRGMFVRWAIYGLVFGFVVPGIDNAAHIGGMLGGMVFGWLVPDLPSLTQSSIYLWKALQVMVALLVLFSFMMIGLRPFE